MFSGVKTSTDQQRIEFEMTNLVGPSLDNSVSSASSSTMGAKSVQVSSSTPSASLVQTVATEKFKSSNEITRTDETSSKPAVLEKTLSETVRSAETRHQQSQYPASAEHLSSSWNFNASNDSSSHSWSCMDNSSTEVDTSKLSPMARMLKLGLGPKGFGPLGNH